MTIAVAERPAPSVFVSHGAPDIVLADDQYTRALQQLGERLGSPAAFVVMSAHWLSMDQGGIAVGSGSRPETIYDFGGFAPELYRIKYPAPGDPALAAEVAVMLEACGLQARLDQNRGWDHGVWIPLRLIAPDMNIPIVEISVPIRASGRTLIHIGQLLAPLRNRGIVLLGSGGLVHNLGAVRFDQPDRPTEPWAAEFEAAMRAAIEQDDHDAIVVWNTMPSASQAVPTVDHFDPLLFFAGTRLPGDSLRTVHEGFMYGSLSMTTLMFEASV